MVGKNFHGRFTHLSIIKISFDKILGKKNAWLKSLCINRVRDSTSISILFPPLGTLRVQRRIEESVIPSQFSLLHRCKKIKSFIMNVDTVKVYITL